MSQSWLVVAKDETKGAKGKSGIATTRHSLSPATTKDEFVALLKDLNDRELYNMFLRSQRKFLENKGLTGQFSKMHIKKFKELMKVTLAIHNDWPKWKKSLHETFRDYSGIPALWHLGYERLWTLEGIRPPHWVRDLLDTPMDPGLLTKDEAEVYRLVAARLAELAGKDDDEADEEEAATRKAPSAAAAASRAAVERMVHLTSCPIGTPIIPFQPDEAGERVWAETDVPRRDGSFPLHRDETSGRAQSWRRRRGAHVRLVRSRARSAKDALHDVRAQRPAGGRQDRTPGG